MDTRGHLRHNIYTLSLAGFFITLHDWKLLTNLIGDWPHELWHIQATQP